MDFKCRALKAQWSVDYFIIDQRANDFVCQTVTHSYTKKIYIVSVNIISLSTHQNMPLKEKQWSEKLENLKQYLPQQNFFAKWKN